VSDSRSGKRFSLQLPIRIQQANSARKHQAVTNNLSAAGVYISANLPFRLGAEVNFEITLPAPVTGGPRDVQLKCAGRVVRVDERPRGKRRGVACVIDRYRFMRKVKAKAKGEPAC
jgi:PilZ domain